MCGRSELAAPKKKTRRSGSSFSDYFFGFGKNVASQSRSSAVSIR
jgi:hypothetical protein